MELGSGLRLVRMELKYCEGCGGLLLRRSGEKASYCGGCEEKLREFATGKSASGGLRASAEGDEAEQVKRRKGPKRVEAAASNEPRRQA